MTKVHTGSNAAPSDTRIHARPFHLIALIGGALLLAATPASAQDCIRVGMVKSFFREVPDPVAQALLLPFATLVQQNTGCSGKISVNNDALELARQLDKGAKDLGIFQGFEFAWLQPKFPKLKPLMIAIHQDRYVTVHLVTRAGSSIAHFSDLKGKRLCVPLQSGGHCYLFFDRHCDKLGCAADKYFAKIVKPASIERGLDDVVRGDVDAAIVDSSMLECYAVVNPGCMKLLRTIEESKLFPAPVIAYREGALPQKTLDAFRTGMLKANKQPESRGLMTLWRMTAFDSLPDDYGQSLQLIAKEFPAPSGW